MIFFLVLVLMWSGQKTFFSANCLQLIFDLDVTDVTQFAASLFVTCCAKTMLRTKRLCYLSSKNVVKFSDILNLNWRIRVWWDSDGAPWNVLQNFPKSAFNIFSSSNFFQNSQ